ncbi:MAG TPA: MFS transporter [Solirubrobacteraceae bacterium]|nr:MFS transporter [Solirubrobacteraceae bacterium]
MRTLRKGVARAGAAAWRGFRWTGRRLRGELVKRVGGPARAHVIVLFAAVLALSGADASTVGAAAPQLEQALHVGNAKIGLLSSVALLVGALLVLPVGALVDRIKRIPLLAVSIVLWSLASLLSAFAGSYGFLLLARLALGAVNATAGPAIASLTGDYFAAAERGRVYAYILGGEIAGTAAGFIVSGSVASAVSWRAPFVMLALPGLWLARTLWRTVPEPLRGGQSRLTVGMTDVAEAFRTSEHAGASTAGRVDDEQELAHELTDERGLAPDPRLVLHDDPRAMTLIAAVRYVLRIPTNRQLIIGSSLGYFFFAGLQTFVVLFIRDHYGIGQLTAELALLLLVAGAMAGTLASGRVTDLLLRRGMLEARVWVPGLCYLGAACLLIPGFVIHRLTPALWFDIGGAALLAAANPPLDAARLDIVPSGLWGRAESTRGFLRSLAQALAPLLFGGLASVIAGTAPQQAQIGGHTPDGPGAGAGGLEVTFLIMLVALFVAAAFLARARRTYPQDVATAAACRETNSALQVGSAASGAKADVASSDETCSGPSKRAVSARVKSAGVRFRTSRRKPGVAGPRRRGRFVSRRGSRRSRRNRPRRP